MASSKPVPLNLVHQVEGTQFLRGNERAALFDEQGLGKSKQLIDALAGEIAAGNVSAGLIVCPNGLKTNWTQEIEKFCALPYAVFGTGQAARRVAFSSLKASFYVINYEAVHTELASLKALLKFKRIALVLDESHRIKTPDAKTTKAILALRSHAARRYILTGTPVANKPEDLWSQMLFLDDGESLGTSFEEFQRAYRAGTEGYKNVDQLRDRVAAKSLRRTKAGSLDLPPKQYTRIAIELDGTQRSMYDAMRNEMELWVRSLDGEQVSQRGDAILARMVRLAQLASNPGLMDTAYSETPAKFRTLDRLLAHHLLSNPTQKVIVWSSFVGNIETLRGRYAKWNPVVIHGEVTNEERDAAVTAFRSDLATRLLFANPAAAREGLTLTEANVAIYVDRTFNLVDYLQSQDRIHRISQTQACEIVLLVARDTVDEFIDFSLEQKHRLARFAQSDTNDITIEDLQLHKPDVLRALIRPIVT
jgi:SWI/SNF-related matrix-associated actin-dependent regulator 1 of chromatin subfamily A